MFSITSAAEHRLLMGFSSAGVSFFRLLFLTVPLETNYLRPYWTDLHQIFRMDTIMHWVGMINDQSDLLFAIAQGTLL